MMTRILLLLVVLVALCLAEEHRLYHHHHKVLAGPLTEEDLRQGPHRARAAGVNYFYPANKIRPIYGLSSDLTKGQGKTICIIDAFGYSSAQSDLQAFASANGLPAITSSNFEKVAQDGSSNIPGDDPNTQDNWATESALDLQTAHLIAPAAKKIYIACKSAYNSDLFQGVKTAKTLGCGYISMSWGGAESAADLTSYDSLFTGVTACASTGDSGSAGGVSYPASSQNVIAVGGTTVYTNSDGSFSSEQGWSGSGGGCSKYSTASSVQQSTSGYSCGGKKELPDIASVADPNSGFVIYVGQSNICSSPPCLYVVGGTSLAAPLTCARAAINSAQPVTPASIYGLSASSIRDITVGNDGAYSCHAGLDEVTGRGSWLGAN